MDERVRGDEAEAVIRRLAELQREREERDSDPTVADVARLAGASEEDVREALLDVRQRQIFEQSSPVPHVDIRDGYERIDYRRVRVYGSDASAKWWVLFVAGILIFTLILLLMSVRTNQPAQSEFFIPEPPTAPRFIPVPQGAVPVEL